MILMKICFDLYSVWAAGRLEDSEGSDRNKTGNSSKRPERGPAEVKGTSTFHVSECLGFVPPAPFLSFDEIRKCKVY